MSKATSRDDDSFRMDPVSLGALIGGVVAFIMVGAIVDVLWVAVGALIGGFIGLSLRRYGRRAAAYAGAVDLRENSSKQDLQEVARELGIEGRSQMTKDELVQAITDRRLELQAAEEQQAEQAGSNRRRAS